MNERKISPKALEIIRNSFDADTYGDMLETLTDVSAYSKADFFLRQFITENPDMKKLKEKVKLLSEHSDPVLLTGPTGTGKELLANALHGERTGACIPINCAGLPEHLVESELFGHIKGAFTDARVEKKGIFSEAKRGTVFMDEIGDLPLFTQSKLLRAIQEKKIRPVGSNQEVPIFCRFVFATHRNLVEMVEKETFRADLYYRISTIQLETTALKQRLEDVRPILRSLDKEGKLPADIINKIVELPLPGNVRSLQQMVRRYCLFKEL